MSEATLTCAHCGQPGQSPAASCQECGQPLPGPDDTGGDTPRAARERAAAAFERAFDTVTPHVVLTHVLIAANVIAFLMLAGAGMPLMKPPADFLVRWGATYGPLVTRGEWWRLLTGMFMHAGLFHLVFNMWALFSVGLLTERLFGNVAFLIIYMVAGLGGGVIGLYWHPVTASVGASGAIFGMYGALFAYLLRRHATVPRHFFASAGLGAAVFMIYNLVYGLGDAGIDMAAHVGGLLAGAVAGLALARPLAPAPLATRVRRNTLVAAASAAVLVALAVRLPPVDDFLAALETLTGLEQKSQAAVNRSLGQLREGEISEEQFADAVEQQVLPPWRAQRQALTRMRLPQRERDLTTRAAKYMELRGATWALMAEGIRTRDSALIQKSNATQAAAVQALTEFMRAANPAAPPPPVSTATVNPGNAALQQEVRRFQALEARAVADYNQAVKALQSRRLSNTAFAERLEKTILPEWDAQHQRLLAVRAAGADDSRRKQVAEYMRLRGEAWRLTARGVRTQSAPTLKAAAESEAKAMALARPGGAPPPATAPSAAEPDPPRQP